MTVILTQTLNLPDMGTFGKNLTFAIFWLWRNLCPNASMYYTTFDRSKTNKQTKSEKILFDCKIYLLWYNFCPDLYHGPPSISHVWGADEGHHDWMEASQETGQTTYQDISQESRNKVQIASFHWLYIT